MRFEGIYTPAITPYKEDFSIDKQAFASHIDWLIDNRVHGIIFGGTTGEYYAQSPEERFEMMWLAAKAVNKRVPLVLGTGALRTEDSVMYAAHAKKVGADALLIGTPPYSCPTGREIALHALKTQRAAELPCMLYNYPGRMSVNMDEETLDRLGMNPNFCAIKESSGDINRLHMLARDYPHIQLSCGMDDQALEFFAWGARSWVCAGSNFAPRAHIALYEACVVKGDFDKGRRIMSALLPILRVLEQGGKFIQCVKYAVELRGLRAGPPRYPMRPLFRDEKRHVREVIETMDTIIAEIDKEPKL